MILVEKDFLSFGHLFAKRSGHLSNEKFFIDRFVQATPPVVSESPPSSGRSSPSVPFPSSVVHSIPSPSSSAAAAARDALSSMASRISLKSSTSKPPQMKETSPVFHQFLDAVYQLVYVYPNRFQFNERFLRRLLYHAYSCQYGSFLYDSERERMEAKVRKKARCVWDYFLARRKEFINTEFDASLDEGEGVLFPKGDNVRWWAQAWGRTDAEMNGPGRGTNVREERQNKDERDQLQERLQMAVRNASSRKLSDGIGSAPSQTRESCAGDELPKQLTPPLPTEVVVDQEPVIEGDPSAEKIDSTADGTAVVNLSEDANTTTVETSDYSIVGSASTLSNTIESSEMSASEDITESQGVELDPLGGGVEMTTLTITSPLRNR